MIRSLLASAALFAFAACGEGQSTSTHQGDLRFRLPGSEALDRETAHDFGEVSVGTSARVTMELVNVGRDRAQVTETRFENAPSGAFFVQAPDAVGPGDSETVVVTFAPPAEGPYTARLVIANDGQGGDATVELTGAGR